MNLPKTPALIAFLHELFDTNNEFANKHSDEFFAKFRDKQDPQLTIVLCSDSRVQMESFDNTPQNDIFAIRNIGNQIQTCEGSVDFGIEVLETPFLLIIGHSNCGAVVAVFEKQVIESDAINKELQTINITSDCIHEAIIENIDNQVSFALKKYHSRVESGKLTIIGAVYDFKNDFGFGRGRVVLTNVNGIADAELIKKQYKEEIKNLHCYHKK